MADAGRSCADHPKYRTARPPASNCVSCWAAYGKRRAIEDGLRSSARKMKKPHGSATKAKGRDLMLAIKALLLLNAPWLSEDDFLVKATSMLGVDLHVSPRAAEWFPFAVEGKNTETLQIWAALTQAQYNAAKQGKPAIVFFKRAGTPIYVALAATDLLTLLPWPKNLPTPPTSSATPDPTP